MGSRGGARVQLVPLPGLPVKFGHPVPQPVQQLHWQRGNAWLRGRNWCNSRPCPTRKRKTRRCDRCVGEDWLVGVGTFLVATSARRIRDHAPDSGCTRQQYWRPFAPPRAALDYGCRT
jgi:hypothetical protein